MVKLFVSYFITDESGRQGFGNTGMTLDGPIDGIDDVRKLESLLRDAAERGGVSGASVKILNWKSL